MTYRQTYPDRGPESASPVFRFVGNLFPSDYDKQLNTIGLTPDGTSLITLVSSSAGGDLAYSINGIVNKVTMSPGVEYFVSWPIANVIVVSGPVNDWQNNSVTNTVTDLVIKGY